MAGHNIVGSEATHRARLVAFSHAHGSIRMIARPVRFPLRTLLAFAAGLAAAFLAAFLIGRS